MDYHLISLALTAFIRFYWSIRSDEDYEDSLIPLLIQQSFMYLEGDLKKQRKIWTMWYTEPRWLAFESYSFNL